MNSDISRLAVTVDTDWACESAIQTAIEFLRERRVPATVFSTHDSSVLEAEYDQFEIGLHPYFGRGSSHGVDESAVVNHVLGLPHNLRAFRCHRFEVGNVAYQAMWDAGFRISSNVCTDLEVVAPFANRFGMLEFPVFMEDGGFLFQGRDLRDLGRFRDALQRPGLKVLLMHPMHLALNTPNFGYMTQIKRSRSRAEWNSIKAGELAELRWTGWGIADLMREVLEMATAMNVELTTIGRVAVELEDRRTI